MPQKPPSVRLDLRHGADLSDDEIDALYALRGRFMRLKPEVDPAQDRAWFGRIVRGSQRVGRAIDRASGEPLAMICATIQQHTFEGRPLRLVFLEFGFVDHALRGSLTIFLMYARVWIGALSWRPGVVQLIGGVGYPSGYMRVCDLFGPTWLAGQDDLPPVVAYGLERLIETMATTSWDASRHAVRMNTIPPSPTPGWWRTHGQRADLRRYIAHIPDWQDGHAAPLLARLSVTNMLHALEDQAKMRAGRPHPRHASRHVSPSPQDAERGDSEHTNGQLRQVFGRVKP